jgi:spectrin beta
LTLFRLANGGDYLFQAADEDEMSQWVSAINQMATVEAEGEAGKAHTMPAGALGEKEPKKRSFFTLKKK